MKNKNTRGVRAAISNHFRHVAKVYGQKKLFAALACAASLVAGLVTAIVSGPAVAGALFAVALGVNAFANPIGFLGLTPASQPVRFQNYIDGITGVANSGTATMKIPVDRRYHGIDLRCTIAGALSDPTTVVDRVIIDVAGVEIVNMTSTQLLDEARLYGITPGTGELPIFFTQPWARTNRQQESTSWDLFGQSSCTARITFLNPAGGAVGLTALADFDYSRNLGIDPITKREIPVLNILKKYSITQALANGVNDVTNIPVNRPLQRVLMDVSANAISSVLVTADSVKVHEATKAENDDLLGREGLDGSQYEYPLVFDKQRMLSSGLIAGSLNIRVTTTGALTLTAQVVQRCRNYLG